jgi:hypothetical protein
VLRREAVAAERSAQRVTLCYAFRGQVAVCYDGMRRGAATRIPAVSRSEGITAAKTKRQAEWGR